MLLPIHRFFLMLCLQEAVPDGKVSIERHCPGDGDSLFRPTVIFILLMLLMKFEMLLRKDDSLLKSFPSCMYHQSLQLLRQMLYSPYCLLMLDTFKSPHEIQIAMSISEFSVRDHMISKFLNLCHQFQDAFIFYCGQFFL